MKLESKRHIGVGVNFPAGSFASVADDQPRDADWASARRYLALSIKLLALVYRAGRTVPGDPGRAIPCHGKAPGFSNRALAGRLSPQALSQDCRSIALKAAD